MLTGHVVSQGQAVADAQVRFKGRSESVSTDASGQFRLPIRAGVTVDQQRVTAAKPGYLIAGETAVEGLLIELPPLPDGDDPAYAWIDPTPDETAALNCGNCHQEIYQQWHSGAACPRRDESPLSQSVHRHDLGRNTSTRLGIAGRIS